jgi:predicted DNA binding CopG/RHH family protein
MSAKSEARLHLPAGLSPEEEARWWDEHQDYWDTVDTEWEVVEAMPIRRTTSVKLRLPIDLLDTLKHIATRQGVSHQRLIQNWLEERVDREPAEAGTLQGAATGG